MICGECRICAALRIATDRSDVRSEMNVCLLSFWTAQGKLTAGDEARTRDVHLGKVVLYQLSYTRSFERDNNVQPTAPRNLLIASECSKSLNPNRTFTASYDQTLYE
jgi:hypothetical protein